MTTPLTTPAFTLDPTLPWLRTDPAMQEPTAFVGMTTRKLNASGWAPMGRYFPAGTTLAMVQVTELAAMTPGLYWHEQYLDADSQQMFRNAWKGVVTTFGRFEGFGELSRAQARSHRKGRIHFDLGADVLDCNLSQHFLQEDGTSTCFVNFGTTYSSSIQKLWRITHYVDMPAEALATLGAGATSAAGLNANQQRWLGEEEALRTEESCSEYSARVLGGFPEADCRAIMRGQEKSDFGYLFSKLPTLTPSQAKKRKSGAVAITWRSYDYCGKPIGYTNYYKREDADVLLGVLQGRTDLERAQARVAAQRNALANAADAVRYPVHEEAKILALEAVAEPSQELALAA